MEVEKLLLKIHAGKRPSETEMEEVASLLSSVDASELVRSGIVDDVYNGILVIGKGKLFEYGHLVAKFLDSQDALTVALVLEILCLEWGISDEYFERLIDFSLGASWDVDDDVRLTSIRILGEFLLQRFEEEKKGESQSSNRRRSRMRKVAELLLGVLEDDESPEEIKSAAFSACLRALGRAEEELPVGGVFQTITEDERKLMKPLFELRDEESQEPSSSPPSRASASETSSDSSKSKSSGIS